MAPSDPDDLNPHTPGSTAWFDPAMRALHEPAPIEYQPPETAGLPLWPHALLAAPVIGAVLSTDPDTSALIRLGWFPLLLAVCAYLAWWHLWKRP